MTETEYVNNVLERTDLERNILLPKIGTEWEELQPLDTEEGDTKQEKLITYPKPEIEEFSHEQLVDRLIEIENNLGKSSVELFRKYISEDIEHDEEIEEWFDIFFLFLGTDKVKRYICP
jgi:hypothetical protein